MGFLDDIKKNVENAVEGVKSNVEDMLHRPHPEHAKADQAAEDRSSRADQPQADQTRADQAAQDQAPQTEAAVDTQADALAEGPADAAAAEQQGSEPAPQAAADEEWPEPAAEAGAAPGTGAAAEAGAAGVDRPASQEVVVEDGDTMAGIAAQFGVDLDALIDANRDAVPDPDLLRPGQVLRLP